MKSTFFIPSGYVPGSCYFCKGASEDIACDACSRKMEDQRRAEETRQAREFALSRLDAARQSIPSAFRWAQFDAPELRERVKNQAAIDRAAGALADTRVVLVGNAGVGKTSLACAMLHAIIDAGLRHGEAEHRRAGGACFIGAYWLAKARLEYPLGEGEAPLVRRAIEATVLVLDDVGIEQVRTTAIAEVIYERHANELQTILTTGFGFPALVQRYGDGIARRMFEGATIVRCKEPREGESGTASVRPNGGAS